MMHVCIYTRVRVCVFVCLWGGYMLVNADECLRNLEVECLVVCFERKNL
jgi:hypothetical protein